jgi:hypothetical protein
MAAAHKDGKVKKAWAKGTIRNKISAYKLECTPKERLG